MDKNRTKTAAHNYSRTDIAKIRTIAYSLWNKAGKPKNEDLHFWLLGESTLKNEKATMKGEKNGRSA